MDELAANRGERGAPGVSAAARRGRLIHTAKSPLTAIIGFAESLARQAEAGTVTQERLVDRLGRIRQAAERVAVLLDEMGETDADEPGDHAKSGTADLARGRT